MIDTKKKYLNSSPKETDYSTWIYLLIWVFLSGLIIFGVFWTYTWWEKKQELKRKRQNIYNNLNEPIEREGDEKILTYEDARERIITSHELAELLEQKLNEDSHLKKTWVADLQEIKKSLKQTSDLEVLKGDLDQIQEFYKTVRGQYEILNRLRHYLEIPSDKDIDKQIEAQEEWLKDIEQHQDEAFGKIAKLIDDFYWKFLREGLKEEEKTPWNIYPEIVRGQLVRDDFDYEDTTQTKNDVEYIINNFSHFKSNGVVKAKKENVEKIDPTWKGFTGYLTKNLPGSKEGRNTAGVTITGPKNVDVYVGKFNDENGNMFNSTQQERTIEIQIRRNILFNRQNKYYDRWWSVDIDAEGKKQHVYNNINVESLINTIAHELAHAIIETTRFHYHNKDGGHGTIHDDYTDRIRKMIINSSEYEEFVKWWKEPQKNG